jgi:hypothetical protein
VTGFWTFLHGWSPPLQIVLIGALYSFGGLFTIVIGGGIVRKYRFRSLHPARSRNRTSRSWYPDGR